MSDDLQQKAIRLRHTAANAEKLARRYKKQGDDQESHARREESKRLNAEADIAAKGRPASKSARKTATKKKTKAKKKATRRRA